MIDLDDIFPECGTLIKLPKRFKTLHKISHVQGVVSEAKIIIHSPIYTVVNPKWNWKKAVIV